MAGNVSDEAFARAVQQAGVVSYDQLEAAKAAQAESAAKGVLVSLADVLVQQGVITSATRENIEKKVRAQQQGGIQQFGQFKLLKKLGEGGMGAVYLAEDTNAGRQVAIKLLPKKYAGDSEFLSRFRREARAAGQLNHVNIVCAHTVGEELGYHYLVMEYVEGEPLDKILKRDHALTWDKALEIVMQVARGLKHAHEHGIVHRDIKPGNIIVTPKGVAKILDLGLSKTIGGDEQTFHTQTGVAVGTPHYLSPEQARGDKSIDGRTDIYSLGATLYHLVTGHTPFQGSTAAVIMLKHLNEQLTNPQDINENIPDGVAHVIMRMMAKEPADRYRDCKELLDDLELVIDGKDPSSHAIEAHKSSVAVARAARSRKPGAVAPGPRRTAGPVPPVGVRQHVPLDRRGTGQQAADQAEAGTETPPSSKKNLYIAAGFGALAVLVLVIGIVAGRSREQQAAVRAVEEQRKAEADKTARLAEQKRKAEETRLKSEAARLEEERLAAEAKKKSEMEKQPGTGTAGGKPPSEPVAPTTTVQAAKVAQPDTKAGQMSAVQTDVRAAKPDEPPTEAIESPADKAARLFRSVLRELAPLLQDNRFGDALALLNGKLKAPAFADAPDVVKREIADIEAVMELRKAAIDALRKEVGQQVTLKKGGTAFKGKLVNDPKPDVVTLDMGGAQMTFNAMQLSLEDVDQYAPRTDSVGADLRQRGIMYLAAGNAAKAKEYFTKPQTLNPEPYLDRIAALELGEIEAAVLKAWDRAEKLFAAKDMKGAKAAYETFEREHGKTQTAAKQAAALKERYDAIEKVLGPAPQLTLDLGGGVKMEMVLIKAGEFEMGSKDGEDCEKPVHRVKISKPFYIGKYEVTVAQFRAFADAAKYQTEIEKYGKGKTWKDGGWKELPGITWRTPGFPQEDNYPACVITWNDAQEFVKWAVKKTGRNVCLPTEAQWEYACRAGTTTRYNTGDKDSDLEQAAWFDKNSGMHTNACGQKKPNAWGLYDMHGNVWEWVQDYFNDKYYADSPSIDPRGPTRGDRLLRGGSWSLGPDGCRAAHRCWFNPLYLCSDDGFRCVLDLGAQGSAAFAIPPETKPETAADQIDAVLAKLKDLNPGHNGKISQRIQSGQVTMLRLDGWAVADLSPLSVLKGLRILELHATGASDLTPLRGLKLTSVSLWATAVADLSPLRGMPLEYINCGYARVKDISALEGAPLKEICLNLSEISDLSPLKGIALRKLEMSNTKVKDLSPLAGMPLKELVFEGTPVSDISALKGMPLVEVKLSFTPERDAAVLRSIRTLKKINELPAEEFWKKYDTTAVQPETKNLKPETLPKEVSLDLGGGVKMELVLVKAGEFMMGADDGEVNEKPVHKVKISKPYYIGKFNVTVGQFRAFADAAKYQTEAEKSGEGYTMKDGIWHSVRGVNWRNSGFKQEDNHPVVVVTWNDAQDFCKWATRLAGRTVRSPTEAEWEYAARGPQSSKYPWGDKWEGITANVADASLRRAGFDMGWGETKEDDGYPFTSPGGAYKNASWCGAYDMAGNVWQWCQDYFNDRYYAASPAIDPQGPANGGDHVLRGGSWANGPGSCRSERRDRINPGYRAANLGFRVVVEFGSSRTP